MTSKERVLTTLDHREPDRVPYFEQGVASRVASEILGRKAHTGGGGFRRNGTEAAMRGSDAYAEYVETYIQDWGDLIEELDFDVVTIPWAGGGVPQKKLDENTYLFGDPESDNWTIMRFSSESDTLYTVDSALNHIGVPLIERRVRAMEEWRKHRSKPTRDSFSLLQRFIDRFGGERAIGAGGLIVIPMEPAWLEAIALRPDLVEIYLDINADRICDEIDVLAEMGIDLVWGGGDLASNLGPAYSPEDFRILMLPRLKRITTKCHEHKRSPKKQTCNQKACKGGGFASKKPPLSCPYPDGVENALKYVEKPHPRPHQPNRADSVDKGATGGGDYGIQLLKHTRR